MKNNIMMEPVIEKVVVHMGVGESGQHLVDAENILYEITGQKVIRSFSKMTIPAFGIKKREPIGCKVTLRGINAHKFLESSLKIIDNTLRKSQFDINGNVSFGIEEHTDFDGMKYDPNVGVFGMDVNIVIKRKGERVSNRKIEPRKVSKSHKMNINDSMKFLINKYNVEVI